MTTQLLWALIGAAIGAFNGALGTWVYLASRHDCLPHDPAQCRGTVHAVPPDRVRP